MGSPVAQPDAWYVRSFGELYPVVYQHRDDGSAEREVRALVELMSLRPSARVLDICCGNGRHMSTLLEMGFDVTGVDLSDSQLRRAAERSGLADRLIRADVRDMPFEASFDGAVNLFTSFGYFRDDAENLAALRQMRRALVPGGVLALDHINRRRLERDFEPFSREERDGWTIESRRSLTDARSYKQTLVTEPSGQTHVLNESVRIYEPEEIASRFEEVGFTDIRLFGSYDGEAFTETSPRMIVLGNRG